MPQRPPGGQGHPSTRPFQFHSPSSGQCQALTLLPAPGTSYIIMSHCQGVFLHALLPTGCKACFLQQWTVCLSREGPRSVCVMNEPQLHTCVNTCIQTPMDSHLAPLFPEEAHGTAGVGWRDGSRSGRKTGGAEGHTSQKSAGDQGCLESVEQGRKTYSTSQRFSHRNKHWCRVPLRRTGKGTEPAAITATSRRRESSTDSTQGAKRRT